MKTINIFFLIFLIALQSGCGSGGGGGPASAVPADNSVAATYSVSTLTLSGHSLVAPAGLAIDAQDNLYVADADVGSNLILKIAQVGAGPAASVSSFLGGGSTDYNTCSGSRLYSPYGVAIDSSSGTLYVAERNKSTVRYADCSSSPSVSAQYGSVSLDKSFSAPSGIALSGSNLYVADTGNHKIWRITNTGGHSGSTLLVAGTTSGYVNGSGGVAAFSSPTGVAVSLNSGNVFVTDTNNCAIRVVTAAGEVSTFAGAGPTSCGSADGVGLNAQFDHPTGIAIDANDNLYVADSVSNKIRRISPQGVVTTLAGTGASGSNDGLGSAATFNTPTGIVVNASGHLFVVDAGTSKIRKITLTP